MKWRTDFRAAMRSILAISVLITSIWLPHCQGIDLATIERAWRDRELQTEQLVIRWSESRVNRPLSQSGGIAEHSQPQEVPDLAMCFSGRKLRWETALMSKQAGDPIERDIGAFNGAEARELFFPPDHPTGVIFAPKRPHFSGRQDAWPLLLFYRGCDAGLADCTLDDFELPINGPLEDANGNVILWSKAEKKRQAVAARAKPGLRLCAGGTERRIRRQTTHGLQLGPP